MSTDKESWDKFIGIIARPQETVKRWSEDDLRAVLNSTTPVELSSLNALERADIVAYWKTLNAGNQGLNPVNTISPADRLVARLSLLSSKTVILDSRTVMMVNRLFKDVNFDSFPRRQLQSLVATARSHLMSSTCKSVMQYTYYALDGHINSRVYYAFAGAVPYAVKILSNIEAQDELKWSNSLDFPHIVKYVEKIAIKPGADIYGLVMKLYARTVDDMLLAWQMKGPAYTAPQSNNNNEEDVVDDDDDVAPLISSQAVANVFLSVMYAIRYLNQRNLCHSDIKPSNILIDSTGTIVLADLGAMVPYDNPLVEATQEFSLIDMENPLSDYGKAGCLLMDMVCLASTLMAFATHKRAKRFIGLQARIQVWKRKGNFAAVLADICLGCSTSNELANGISKGKKAILEHGCIITESTTGPLVLIRPPSNQSRGNN